MTSALTITMTHAGLQRFTEAQVGDGIALPISSVGLTNTPFVIAPTLTALPGEFRRVTTLSGDAVGDNIVHLLISDDAEVGYTARGLGLFLSDGTLFAVYCQAEPLFEKSPLTTLLAAIDIAFPTADIDNLVFPSTDFLNPPATTTRRGVAELATQAEVDAGTDEVRIVTPKKLATRLVAISNAIITAMAAVFVPLSQRGTAGGVATLGGDGKVTPAQLPAAPIVPVTSVAGKTGNVQLGPGDVGAVSPDLQIATSGLVKGGRTLAADVELHVDAATPAQVRAGTASDVVITPAGLAALASDVANTGEYQPVPGVFHKIGTMAGSFAEGPVNVVFRSPFPATCLGVWITALNSDGSTVRDVYMQCQSLSATGFTAYVQKTGTAGDSVTGFTWFAVGC